MGEKLFKVELDDKANQFAPFKETIKVKVNEDAPEGMKIDKMTLLVRDYHGVRIYKEVWGKNLSEQDLEKAKQTEGEGPPTSYEWNGENNQLEPVEDAGGKKHVHYANPLGSPYEINVVAELSKGADLEEPPEDVATVDLEMPCNRDEEPPPKEKPILESLQVKVDGAPPSDSFRLQDIAALPAEKDRRFCFATGKEENPQICWKITGELDGTKGKLELFTKKELIWSYKLDSKALATGTLDEKQATKDFFDKHLSVLNSPYKLKLSLEGESVGKDMEVAWTYIDVLVDRIELYYGDAKFLPDSKNDVRTREELLILRGLKEIEPGEPSKDVATSKLLKEDTSAPKKLVDEKPLNLELRSNIFYQGTGEWDNGTAFKKYKDLWGDGPRIPIFADVYIRNAKGESTIAPKACEGLRILWDWEDPCLEKERGTSTEEFLNWAFNKKNPEGKKRVSNDFPRSTNCHKDFGGKIGDSATPVFPLYDGCDGEVEDGVFPFAVEPVSNRKWAVLSTVFTGEDENCAGRTGVVFQPSRIAGDTYRVRAYLFLDEDSDFEHAISGDEIWEQAEVADLPRKTSGIIEVWRRVDILRYFRKMGELPAIDLKELNKKFASAKLKFYMPEEDDDDAVRKIWEQGVMPLIKTRADAKKKCHTKDYGTW
jgi:hypothetical protein